MAEPRDAPAASAAKATAAPVLDEVGQRAALAAVRRRLIPFLFLLYIFAYLDRINIGFAALQMREDLGLDAAVYGFGAGIFFVGYFLLEVPSNLVLARVGARRWIARIMISWGIVAAAMAFVTGPASFYALRFLLGAAEAGFFPGIIFYLTYWFPDAERGRAIALFMTATAIAGVIGGPVSGALLSLHGAFGLRGWQWLFLLEGLPSIALGAIVLFYLTDRPEEAGWLTPGERAWLGAVMAAEREERDAHAHPSLLRSLTDRRVLLLSAVCFAIVQSFYGVSLWLPEILHGASQLGALGVGLVSAIPYVCAAVGMVSVGRHSDHAGERRWHIALPATVGAIGLVLCAAAPSPVLSIAALSLAALGIWGSLGPFWALPTAMLGGTGAAGGIALINSIGNLGGFVGPYAVGLVKQATSAFAGGLVALAAVLLVGAGLALLLREPRG
jgi:ACS family tartrate transporter-like MFS transporter